MTSKQKNSSILLLYDHSSQTGNGHIRRCEYFSKIFPRKFNINYQKYNSKFLRKSSKQIYDYIIIDSYKINYYNEKQIKNFCKKLITIDDECNRKFASDVIINYSPLVKKKDYKKKCLKKTKLFLGDKYNFIVKKKINKNLNTKVSNKNKLNVLIYLGTKNRSDLINKIIKTIIKKKNINKIYLFNKKKIISHSTFLKKIEQSDILLTSSGVTLQEGLMMKKMIFATFFSKNQKNFYKYYKQKNLIQDLKNFSQFAKLEIKKINSILNQNKLNIENYLKRKINNKKLWTLVKNV